jgi:hypothetical protein
MLGNHLVLFCIWNNVKPERCHLSNMVTETGRPTVRPLGERDP